MGMGMEMRSGEWKADEMAESGEGVGEIVDDEFNLR
jgi:hypothetical protein